MDGKKLRVGFLSQHRALIKRLDTEGLLPYLVAEGLITHDDSTSIRLEGVGSMKTDKLLTVIHRRGFGDPSVYVRFLQLLSDTVITAGQHLESLVKAIKDDSLNDSIARKFSNQTEVLEENHNASLQAHKRTIVGSLNVDEVLPYLVAEGVVTILEKEDINAKETAMVKAELLVKFIRARGSPAFVVFVKVLSSLESYEHLARLLESPESAANGDDEKYVDEILKRGHVPPRYGVYVERKDMIQRIRGELVKLKEGDGWVLVHGMAGFGKTVLAAEAVRDAAFMRENFPGGVNWLTVGKMTNRAGELDTAKLFNKLHTLILRLDSQREPHPLPTLEAATDYLQKVISEQHPRSLLILDDVWSKEVAQCFAVRCRTMVTSRKSTVANSVTTPHIYSVSVSEGFNEEDGRGLLSQWVNSQPDQLPEYADSILKYCRGSPMAIGLIGAILRKNNREAKWKAVASRLEKKHSVSSIELHAAVNEWNYQHPTLNASMELSVESLPAKMKGYFEMFVVFDHDTLISGDALETIWELDSLDAEDVMMELVGYSLAQQANPGAENPDYLLYFIHDIVLDYLGDTIPTQRQVEFHRRVVARYTDKCNGAFARLPNDNYVYQKLIGHIAAAGNYDLLGDMLSKLCWIISCAQFGDANTLLANYRDHKAKVPEQFCSIVSQCELFVSGHMDVLADSPSQDEVLQLALLLPDSSEVYRQAIGIVQSMRKKSWFKWSNKESDPEKYALKLKLHAGGVRRCQYSQDGRKALSCASDGSLRLWDSSTGMVLGDYKGHDDQVTCCALSHSERMVLSCSEDCTVKVWNTKRKKLLWNFTNHQYGVQCCAFSPDDELVLSADIDSCIMIWEALTGHVRACWRLWAVSPAATPTSNTSDPPSFSPSSVPARADSNAGGEGVLSCAFAPDGDSVVTTSQNGAVRHWDLSGRLLGTFPGHTGQVRCCVFSPTGELLATASIDATARVWDTASRKCEWTLPHDENGVLSCGFSPDSAMLITGDTIGCVKVWSVQSGQLLQDLPLHWDWVNCVLYSPTAQHILSAADNGIIKILWNESIEPKSEGTAPPMQYHRRFSAHFHLDPLSSKYQATILCCVEKSRVLQVVHGAKAEVVLPELPSLPSLTPRSWVLSSKGNLIVIGYVEGALQLFRIDRGVDKWSATVLWTKNQAHGEDLFKCYFSPDDSKIVSCSSTQHKMWLAENGREVAVVSAKGSGVRPCIFFKDSVRVASAQDEAIMVWDSNTGVPQLKCKGIIESSEEDSILCINLSNDNSKLVGSSTSGLVMVWSTTDGGVVFKSSVAPLTPCARSCALSPDGSFVAAGFDDGSLKIWNTAKGRDVHCPTGSDYWMIDVAFSESGKTVVSLCDSIEWWKVDGTHVKRVKLKGAFGKYIKFSPDFSTFVTIDNAGQLYMLCELEK